MIQQHEVTLFKQTKLNKQNENNITVLTMAMAIPIAIAVAIAIVIIPFCSHLVHFKQ
ncbi:hypothetical protein [Ramlibacter sp.]|uniref:hypothetical protein n=1 Tax=Ramlibacter sp. TaxID=1917967 RepID=UPI00179B97D0|nr:hypothetical protein [Ramlibacter sp.]MBA2672677.1 hypothetical protein [Ramlibacter sp.]